MGALCSSPSLLAGCGGCTRPICEVWRRGAAVVHGGLLAATGVVMVAQTRGGVDAVGRGWRLDLSAVRGSGDGWWCRGGCVLAARLLLLWRQGWRAEVRSMVACSVGPRLGLGERRGLGQRPGVVASLVMGYGGVGRYGGLPAAWCLHGNSAVPAATTVSFSVGVGSFAGGLFQPSIPLLGAMCYFRRRAGHLPAAVHRPSHAWCCRTELVPRPAAGPSLSRARQQD